MLCPRCLLVLLLVACSAPQRPPRLTTEGVAENDNRRAAGTVVAGTLRLSLEVHEADWRWEQQLPAYRIMAFSEPGGPTMTPGPLVRVHEGTSLHITITNRVDLDLVVHGLHARPGSDVPVRVPARGTIDVRFQAGAAGTYYYWGERADGEGGRELDDSQLHGAFVVDPPGGSPPDRIFVIGYHAQRAPVKLDAWVINGRSWPETERLEYAVGEPVHWRWINATTHNHPMHLHGTYFRVHSKGDNLRDIIDPDPPSVVTEAMRPRTTMALTWTPERPGNWLFHCHILFHVLADNRLQLPNWYDDYGKLAHDQHMAGLVLGIHARGRDRSVPSAAPPRKLALAVGERPGVRFRGAGLDRPGLGYGLDGGPITAPGPMLVLERDQPVEISITSHIQHATQVHWHGIELESYYDGVPHWGGDSRQMTPQIDPGGSFVAKFTPPRAGTFIYHTHFNDYVQLASGLLGALIVVEPGRTYDPAVDHVFVVSRDGFLEESEPILVNGSIAPPPLVLRAGTVHRLRFIGITPVVRARITLRAGARTVEWRAIAKDGADLPASAATQRPAELLLFPGETYDFELVAPPGAADLDLDVLLEGTPQPIRARMRLEVR